MAFRAKLSYVDLKATVSFSEIRVIVSQEETRTSLSFTDAKTSVHSQLVQTLVQYVNLNSLVQYVNLSAVDVLLDADSKNLYFIPQNDSPNALSVTMLEDTALEVGKSLVDTPVMQDAPELFVGKNLSDSLVFGEVIDVLLTFVRNFSDSYTFTDNSVLSVEPVYTDNFNMGDAAPIFNLSKTATTDSFSFADIDTMSFSKGTVDTIPLTDTEVFDLSIGKTDTFSFNDASAFDFTTTVPLDSFTFDDTASLEPGLGKSDSLSMDQVFSRTVIFARSFNDAVSLDDIASVNDPLQTDVNADKTNVFGFTDDHSYTFSKILSDTYGMSDSPAIEAGKPFADSFSFTDAPVISPSLDKTDSISVSEALFLSLGNSYTDSATITEVINVVTVRSHSVINAAGLNIGTLN